MPRIFAILICSYLTCALAPAQITGQPIQITPSTDLTVSGGVQATGSATISVTPDQAQLSVGVVTQGATAQEAGTLNANLATAVQNALRTVLGLNGTIQTIGYSVYPRTANNSSAIIGYTASNTILVTTNSLNIIGSLIDTANQAGANTVSNVTFGLQNPDPVLLLALTSATKQAIGHAGAIAAGFGKRVGSVLSASEGSSYTPIVAGGAPTASSTPIQSGTVGVSATVTLTVSVQ